MKKRMKAVEKESELKIKIGKEKAIP